MISATYYFSIQKVNTRSQTLKVETAKHDFLSLDQNLLTVMQQPGSARTIDISDSGGKIKVSPLTNTLAIRVSDNSSVDETIFNGTIGQVSYELPYVDSPETGLFLKGDSRTIGNQSGSVMSQLYIERGVEHPEILLRYRPIVTTAITGSENGTVVNTVRIYLVNLNSSSQLSLGGALPLKTSFLSTSLTTNRYDLAYEARTLNVSSVLSGVYGNVIAPISGSTAGTIINVELVQCNLKIERCLR
jgi:hypothetical protein